MQILGLSDSTPKPTSRLRELFWPKIDDDVAAVTAARNAMYVYFLIAAINILAILGGAPAAAWLDVAFYAMIGIGVRQLSRTAAIAGFILYGLSSIATVLVLSPGIIVRVILLALVLGGVRAAVWAYSANKPTAIEEIANPQLDTTGVSTASVTIEKLPGRVWPIMKVPFFIGLWLLLFLNLATLSSLTFVEQWTISTGSMAPTLRIGERAVSLRSWLAGPVQRGDVIVFYYPVDPRQIFPKRVVGLPGDRIRIMNKDLYVNGVKVSEVYVEHVTDYMDSYRDNFPAEPNSNLYPSAIEMLQRNVVKGELVVPSASYFVLGDNRDQSLDSRYWGFVPVENVKGRMVMVLWSATRARSILSIPRVKLGATS